MPDRTEPAHPASDGTDRAHGGAASPNGDPAHPAHLARHRRARRALIVAMLIAPLTITAIAVLVMLLAGGDLGREVVIHWNGQGPDGWGPAWTYPVLVGAIGIVLPVVMWLSVSRTSRVSGTAVFLAGLMIWLTAFLGVGMTEPEGHAVKRVAERQTK